MDSNFAKYINYNGPIPAHKPELGPCWLWKGHHDKRLGYAKFSKRVPGKKYSKSFKAHRYAYEQEIGPIPEGLVLDHLCRNRGCVRPTHTEPVTQLENVLRGEGFGAKNAARTHCKAGHILTPAPWDDTRRCCLPCMYEGNRLRYHQRKNQGKVG